jgi:hypothetical protein
MRRLPPWLVPALGALLCAAGTAVVAWADESLPNDFGLFAYSPPGVDIAYDSDLLASFDDTWPLLWTGRHLWGVGLLVAGLLVLGGWVGRLLARRRGVPGGPVVGALGALAGLLFVGGVVLVLTGDAPAVVTYGGSYEPMSGIDASGAAAGAAPVRVSGTQLAGLGTAVLGAVLAAAVVAAATSPGPPGPGVPGPRRAAGWVAAGAGALLAVAGLLLASRSPAVDPELAFLSPEQYDQLVDAAWLAGVGRFLLACGVLLGAGAVPWLLGGTRAARARTAAGAVLGAAVGLVVLGAVLLWSAHTSRPAVAGVAADRLTGPELWAGLVVILLAGALLGAGVRQVTGRRPAH